MKCSLWLLAGNLTDSDQERPRLTGSSAPFPPLTLYFMFAILTSLALPPVPKIHIALCILWPQLHPIPFFSPPAFPSPAQSPTNFVKLAS